jgi:hypothetical protein
LKRKKVKKTQGRTSRVHSLEKAIKENNELLQEVIEKLDNRNNNSNNNIPKNFHPMLRKQQNTLDDLEDI